MSRVRVTEVSSPISLFPFIGILLCTMAALLVILIAVSRSARDSAQQQVAARQQPVAPPADDEDSKKLEQIHYYVAKLKQVETEAQRKLRDDQLRLSHIEDHIRRLQEQLKSAEAAAIELIALEEEHYDDRRQAEREVQRLHKLIAESQHAISDLKEQNSRDKRSYALVPYEGPNGTHRRPIYIECVEQKAILQPEGVEITSDDLRPPLGPGNPLAAALRAAREHLIRLYPSEGQSRDTEPYPLLLVRPAGWTIYNEAREAIEAGDFDFGFELVEADWELKYPTLDPALAAIEQQAIELARARQEILAAAAPKVYRHPGLAASGEFEFADEQGGGGHGRPGAYVVVRKSKAGGQGFGEGGSGEGGPDEPGSGTGADGPSGDFEGSGEGGEPGDAAAGAPDGRQRSGASMATAKGNPGGQQQAGGAAPSDDGGVAMPANADQAANNISMMTGSPPSDDPAAAHGPSAHDPHHVHSRSNAPELRGQDWALRNKPKRSVPIQRTIHVVVRQDQLAILPESASANRRTAEGIVIPLKGDTVESIDEFVEHVREHVDGWGIAGDGLYWRPILLLNVGPNGERRASDLARLLKNSGLEIRNPNETARSTTTSGSNETR